MPGSSTEQLTKPPEAQASSQQLEGRKGRGSGGRKLPGRGGSAEEMSPGSSEGGACPTAPPGSSSPSAARELPKSHDLLLLPHEQQKEKCSVWLVPFGHLCPTGNQFYFAVQKKLNKTEVP